MSFIARYVYTYEEFVWICMTEASAVQQNDSDGTKTDNKRIKIEQVNSE